MRSELPFTAICLLLSGCTALLGLDADPELNTITDGGQFDGPVGEVDGGGAAASCDGTEEHGFVISQMTIPASATEANALALDLDGDSNTDNAFGALLGNLATTTDIEFQSATDEQVARGTVIQLIGIDAPSLQTATTSHACTYTGESPSTNPCTDPSDLQTCGQHLLGSTSFNIDGATPLAQAVAGTISNDRFDPPLGPTPPAAFFIALSLPGVPPLILPLAAARISVSTSIDSLTGGILAGALSEDTVDTLVLPAMRDSFAALAARDCAPDGNGCNCQDGSAGSSVLNFFDADGDCAIPLGEFSSNSLVDSTLRNPDLDLLDAQNNPGTDGVPDHLSVGLGFTAASATF